MTLFASIGGPFRAGKHPSGTRLLTRDTPVERIWLVESGRVTLSRTTEGGAPHVCASRGGGAIIGLEGISGHAAQRDAVVVADAELLSAPISEVIEWLGEGAPELLRLASEEHARGVAEGALAAGDATVRTARFLVARARDPLMAGWNGARLWEVACLLNIRPETLSRALRELEARGLIRDGRRPEIVDHTGIARLAGSH